MKKEEFLTLATKYLSREASVDEIEHLNSLVKQKKYSVLFNTITEKWEKAGHGEPSSEYNIERGIKVLTAKIRSHHPSFRWEKDVKQHTIFFYRPMYLRIAASFAVLIILVTGALFVVNVLKQRSVLMAWNEKKTVMGEKSIVTLLDGTKITLNADSKLKYPVRFGEDLREVSLEGEAYFEVTQQANKPFVVHTGKVSTTDLGTKFNISAFPSEEIIAVSLEEGKVEVSTNNSGAKKEDVILSPAQQLIYNKEKETSTIELFESQKALGWKDNILVFDNEPLSKVLVPLERYFGVKFEIADQVLADRTIKANFKNESFWTVVKVIEKATGLAYKTSKENNELKKIVFYEK
ncbi:MAG: FecR domain-containing protein [Ignavibacteriales bacterium]|nr:FecR domain-containing protein [Ignavibacteriales bacterium]